MSDNSSNIETNDQINELCRTYHLGEMQGEPKAISGGLMHKMFKVSTETNDYAVKWLNPAVMQRSSVMKNMVNSELIANAFSKYLPVIAAKSFEGKSVIQMNDRYYMVFKWQEGKSIFPPAISEANCREIGSALGKLHQLNISVPGVVIEKEETELFDWLLYLERGVGQKASWITMYSSMIDKLTDWNQQVIEADKKLSEYMVISHRDLDPKNVMWNKGKPYFIDWEAAGFVNPYQELLEVLTNWADDGEGNLDKNKFFTLLHAYTEKMSIDQVDWNCVLCSGYKGSLGWLEYSLKRALEMECTDEAERKLGEEQIGVTIHALKKQESQAGTLIEWLNE